MKTSSVSITDKEDSNKVLLAAPTQPKESRWTTQNFELIEVKRKRSNLLVFRLDPIDNEQVKSRNDAKGLAQELSDEYMREFEEDDFNAYSYSLSSYLFKLALLKPNIFGNLPNIREISKGLTRMYDLPAGFDFKISDVGHVVVWLGNYKKGEEFTDRKLLVIGILASEVAGNRAPDGSLHYVILQMAKTKGIKNADLVELLTVAERAMSINRENGGEIFLLGHRNFKGLQGSGFQKKDPMGNVVSIPVKSQGKIVNYVPWRPEDIGKPRAKSKKPKREIVLDGNDEEADMESEEARKELERPDESNVVDDELGPEDFETPEDYQAYLEEQQMPGDLVETEPPQGFLSMVEGPSFFILEGTSIFNVVPKNVLETIYGMQVQPSIRDAEALRYFEVANDTTRRMKQDFSKLIANDETTEFELLRGAPTIPARYFYMYEGVYLEGESWVPNAVNKVPSMTATLFDEAYPVFSDVIAEQTQHPGPYTVVAGLLYSSDSRRLVATFLDVVISKANDPGAPVVIITPSLPMEELGDAVTELVPGLAVSGVRTYLNADADTSMDEDYVDDDDEDVEEEDDDESTTDMMQMSEEDEPEKKPEIRPFPDFFKNPRPRPSPVPPPSEPREEEKPSPPMGFTQKSQQQRTLKKKMEDALILLDNESAVVANIGKASLGEIASGVIASGEYSPLAVQYARSLQMLLEQTENVPSDRGTQVHTQIMQLSRFLMSWM